MMPSAPNLLLAILVSMVTLAITSPANNSITEVTPRDVYIAYTAGRFPQLTECLDDNLRCFAQYYGYYRKDRDSGNYTALMYYDESSATAIPIAVSQISNIIVGTDTTDCDNYRSYVLSTYAQQYNSTYDYCEYLSRPSYYQQLADAFNQNSLMKRSDPEDECIEESCTTDIHCQLTADGCAECVDFGGFGRNLCLFEVSSFMSTGMVQVCSYWLKVGFTIASKCNIAP